MNSVQHMGLFEGLAQDPSYRQVYESDPNSMPIDSSIERLRKYSPFTVSLALPTILDGVVASGGLDDGYLQENLRLVSSLGNSSRTQEYRSSGVAFSSVTKVSKNDYLNAGRGQGSITSALTYSQLNQADATVMAGIASNATRKFSSVEESYNRESTGLASKQAGFIDQRTVIETLRQIKKMADTPPLLMLINPNSFQIQYQRIQNYSEATRAGFVYQAWGEGLQTLSISGVIGAFASGVRNSTQGITADEIAILPPNLTSLVSGVRETETRVPSGVQYASRNHSAAYQQLIVLLNIYNNGALIRDTIGRSKANLMAGKVVLEYDQIAYLGTMKSFSYSFSEEKQMGGLEFSFEFEVKKMLDFSSDTVSLSKYKSAQAKRILSNPVSATPPPNPVVNSGFQTSGALFTSAPAEDEEEDVPGGTGFVLNT